MIIQQGFVASCIQATLSHSSIRRFIQFMRKPALFAALVLFLATSPVHADTLSRPLPICKNIKSYLAYEISSAIKERCDSEGVSMPMKSLHKTFTMTLDDEVSPSSCLAICLVLDTTQGTSMADCIRDSQVTPFINGMMGNATFNQDTCQQMKARLE